MYGNSSVRTWRYFVDGEPEYPNYRVGHGTVVLGEDGFFAAVTDYGSYVFSWRYGRENEPHWFRNAFVHFNHSYILDKMCDKDHWTPEPAIKWIKEMLHEYFPQERDDNGRFLPRSDELRKELEHLQFLEENPYKENFLDWWRDSYFYDDCDVPGMFYDYSPKAKVFAQKFIPRLQAIVKDELKRERQYDSYFELGNKMLLVEEAVS